MSSAFPHQQPILWQVSESNSPSSMQDSPLAAETSSPIWHSNSPDEHMPPPPPYHQAWGISHPSLGEYVCIDQLVGIVLRNRVLLPIFLIIFSLSRNLEYALEALKAYCNLHPTQLLETQVCALLMLDWFVTRLWLTSQQLRKLEQFVPLILTPNPRSAVEYAFAVLDESLRKFKSMHVSSSRESLASFIGYLDWKLLITKLTRTLAMLESQLRQDDPMGECIRWSARGRDRDFVSFPERVRNWVLRSILSDVKPIDVKRCYQLFYEVAKQSRQIYNFSAARAISSTLVELIELRNELGIDASELNGLVDLDLRRLEKAKSANQPFLIHIRDVLPTTVLATNIVNASGIHWRQSQELHLELQGFVSHSDCQLLSPQQYSFSGDQILGFVKNDLIEFEPVVDMPNKIQSILKQYKKATRTGIFVPKTRR